MRPRDLERHVATLDLDEVWRYLNHQMLFGKHLGLRGSVDRLRSEGDAKLARLEGLLAELQAVARGGAMTARAVWRFFPARAHDAVELLVLGGGHDAFADLERHMERLVDFLRAAMVRRPEDGAPARPFPRA